MTITTTARNASLQDLAALLTDQQGRKLDMIVPASTIRAYDDGTLAVKGADATISMEGVTLSDGHYRPTDVCDDGIAEKLGIPRAYLRKMRDQHPGLAKFNINGWLEQDRRSFLLRCFRDDTTGFGIARALLSDRFGIFDNFDALTAALEGIRQSGVAADVHSCDLSERRMIVKVRCPEVQAMAPTLLAGYKSPFTGLTGADNPTVFAGFMLSNSETGGGAFNIVPRLEVQVCTNGMVISKDAFRSVHLGSQLSAGDVNWSHETTRLAADLITSKTKDLVTAWTGEGYLEATIKKLTEKADKPIEGDLVESVTKITTGLTFSKEQTSAVLDFFIKGGQTTVGGVYQAVTAVAQTVENPDVAHEMEMAAARLLGV